MKKITQAVILAGGIGSRLSPLTNYLPKPLLPINGKPVLSQVIDNIAEAGITEIIINVDYKKEMIEEFIKKKYCKKNNYNLNIILHDTSIDKSEEYASRKETTKGVAISIYNTRKLLKDDFLLCAADTIFEKEYLKRIINYYEKNNSLATLSTTNLERKEDIVKKSCVVIDNNNNITRIIEKPELEEVLSTIVSTPLYLFNKKIINYIPKINLSRRGEYELQSAIQLMIDDKLLVKGYMNTKWNNLNNWKMLNDCEDFLKLNFRYIKDQLVR